jgi:HSP20 family protein
VSENKHKGIKHDLDRFLHDVQDTVHPFALLYDEAVWHPYCDVYETESELVIKMEIAGVDKSNLSISIASHKLIIKGVRQDQDAQRERRVYHKMEINQGYFERIVILPEDVASSVSGSVYRNGVLEIRLAKVKENVVDVKID